MRSTSLWALLFSVGIFGAFATSLYSGPRVGRSFSPLGLTYQCNGSSCWIVSPTPQPQYVGPAPVSAPAVAPPSVAALTGAIDPPGGVDRSKGVGSHDALVVGGAVEVPDRPTVGALDLPEDATKPYVTIVGPKDFQDSAKAILERAGIGKSFHVVAYEENAFQAKDAGYSKGVWITGGRQKDGTAKVISLDTELQTLAPAAETLAEALRKDGGILDKLSVPKLIDAVNPKKVIAREVSSVILPVLSAIACMMLMLACFWK